MNENLHLHIKTYLLIVFLCAGIFVRYSDVTDLLFDWQNTRKKFFAIENGTVIPVKNVTEREHLGEKKIIAPIIDQLKEAKPSSGSLLQEEKTPSEILQKAFESQRLSEMQKKKVCLQVLMTGIGANKKLLEFAWKMLPKNSILGFVPSFDKKQVADFYNSTKNGFKVAIAVPLKIAKDNKTNTKLYNAIEKILQNYTSVVNALYADQEDLSETAKSALEEIQMHLAGQDLKLFFIREIKPPFDSSTFVIPNVYLDPTGDKSRIATQLTFIRSQFIAGNGKILLSADASFDSIEVIADFIANLKKSYAVVCD